jgi:hypothetical protein
VPKKSFPKEVIDHWPEIFEDIDVKVVPLEYLHSIHVSFEEGETWIIEFDKVSDITTEEINETLRDLFDEHQENITNVDFRLNTKKVKEDIQKRTSYFLKKRK